MTERPSAELNEGDEVRWIAYLTSFRSTYDAVFQQFGFTFAEAFIAWQLNRVNNSVGDVEVALTGDDERS